MSDSKLVVYTKISPNCNHPRNHAIDTVTIHCMAGNLSVETCGNLFQKESRQASSNYGIGSDGRIALYVHEEDRAWTSGSASNDNRAITIEVANDGGAETGWHVSDKAMNALLDLLEDICRRNGIKKLLWQANKNLIGQIDKQNMTVHRWFQNKACPGDYLYNKHYWIAEQVNKRLDDGYTQFKTYMNRYLEELKTQGADTYAIPALIWAYDNGIMVGDGNNNLFPQSWLKREDMAVILKAYSEMLSGRHAEGL